MKVSLIVIIFLSLIVCAVVYKSYIDKKKLKANGVILSNGNVTITPPSTTHAQVGVVAEAEALANAGVKFNDV